MLRKSSLFKSLIFTLLMVYLCMYHRGVFYFCAGLSLAMILGLRLRFTEDSPLSVRLGAAKASNPFVQESVDCQAELERTHRESQHNISKNHFSKLQKLLPEFTFGSINEQVERRRVFLQGLMKSLVLFIEFFTIHEVQSVRFPEAKDPELKSEIETHNKFVESSQAACQRVHELKRHLDAQYEAFSRKIQLEADRIKAKRKQFMAMIKAAIGDYDRLSKEQNWHQYGQLKLTIERNSTQLKNRIADFTESCDHFFIEAFDSISSTLRVLTHPTDAPGEGVPTAAKRPKSSSVTTDNVLLHVDRFYNAFKNKCDLLFERNDSAKEATSALNQLILLMDSLHSVSEATNKSIAKLVDEHQDLLLDATFFDRAKETFEKLDINLVTLRFQTKFSKSAETPSTNLIMDVLKLTNKIFAVYFSIFQVKFETQFVNIVDTPPALPDDTRQRSEKKRGSMLELELLPGNTQEDDPAPSADLHRQDTEGGFPFEHFLNKYVQIIMKEYSVNAYFKVG